MGSKLVFQITLTPHKINLYANDFGCICITYTYLNILKINFGILPSGRHVDLWFHQGRNVLHVIDANA